MAQDKNKTQDPYAEFGGSVTATQPHAQPASPDDSGFFSGLKRAGSQIIALPSNVYHAFVDDPRSPEEAKMAPMEGRVALGLKRLIVDPMTHEQDVAKQYDAKAAQNTGDNNAYNGPGHMANMHRIASVVPVLGPIAAPIVDRFLNGDKSGAAGEMLGNIVAGAAVPKIAGKVLDKTARVVTQPTLEVSRILHPTASPTELLTRAVKPSVSVPDFEASATNALPELYKQNPKIATVKQLADAADTAAQAKNAEYQGLIAPYRADMVDASPVGYAQMKSIPLTSQIETPEILDATRAKAGAYMQHMPIGDLDTLRIESNAKLQDMLSAPGSDQAAIVRSNPEAARVNATRGTTRDIVYNHIKDQSGINPAPIQNAYGDLVTVKDAANPRSIVFGRQDPLSISEKIGAIAGPKEFVLSKILKNAGSSDGLTRLAFDRYGRSLPAEPPMSFVDRLTRIPTTEDLAKPIGALAAKPNDDEEDEEDPYKDFQQ